MVLFFSTDGACKGNPGPWGWGWVNHDTRETGAGGGEYGTNQIAELTAIREALKNIDSTTDIIIETDSSYSIKCLTEWILGWKKNNWKNSQKKPVKNADLIREIDGMIAGRTGSTSFKWVKGHAGNEFNEIADTLASDAAETFN
ncbi:MAG: ribonuclease HI [Bifidobacteriaceae bacterium]|jgi:ribonuclease HI|nr:ribonuclease HI [Bifidobacteriaceae bacterium]